MSRQSSNSVTSSLFTYDFSRLEFPQLAPVMCFILSSAICRGYNNLIDYCYEVMVICFMADEEMFQGDQRFADHKLTDYFNQLGTESEKAYMKDIEAFGQEKRGAKDVILKKNKKAGQNKVKGSDDEGNSSEEDDDNPEERDEEERRNRGEEIKKMFEKRKKDQEEKDLANKAADADKDKGKKAKIQLTGDTVAGNFLKMAQRQAIATTAKEDKVKLLRKKSDDD